MWPSAGAAMGRGIRRILVERQVRPRRQGVLDVRPQDAAQSAFIGNDDPIEAFAADGSNQPLRTGVLPR